MQAGKEYNDRQHLVPHSDLYVLVKNIMTWRGLVPLADLILLDTGGFSHHCFHTLNAGANTVLKKNNDSVMKSSFDPCTP